MQWWQQPFFQVALPIIVTFVIATWFQSKHIDTVNMRIEDMGKRIDDLRDSLIRRLDAIDARLTRIGELLFGDASRQPR